MKPVILFCAMALVASGVLAQSPSKSTTSKTTAAAPAPKSGVLKKGNSVWIVKPMQTAETMDNGLKVRPNGTVKTASGKIEALEDGDCISQDGKVVGLNNKGLTSAYLKQGKMYKATKVDKLITLSDGSSISPDGKLKKSDGKVVSLKNDEIVDIADTNN